MAQSQLEAANAALFKLGARVVLTAVSTSGTTQEERACANRIEICKRAVLRMHPWNFAIKGKVLTPHASYAISNVTYVSSQLIEVTHASGPTYVAGQYVTIEGVAGATGANGTFEVASVPGATTVRLTAPAITSSTLLGTYSSDGTIRRSPPFGYAYLYDLPSDFIRLLTVDESPVPEGWKLEGGKLYSLQDTAQVRYVYDVTDYTAMDIMFYECLAIYLAWDLCLELGRDNSLKEQLARDLKECIAKARFVDATENPAETLGVDDWVLSRGPRGGAVTADTYA
jgi:hypothetical protein